MADLVTIEDTTDPTCECGHVRLIHGTGGCYSNAGSLYCPCTLTIAEVDRANIERIVRREIAAELDRLADGDLVRRYGTADIIIIAISPGDLAKRAEEIRNG